jgi:hypothetical protein
MSDTTATVEELRSFAFRIVRACEITQLLRSEAMAERLRAQALVAEARRLRERLG